MKLENRKVVMIFVDSTSRRYCDGGRRFGSTLFCYSFLALRLLSHFLPFFLLPAHIPRRAMQSVASPQEYSDTPNQSSTSARTPSPRAFDVVTAYRRALEDDKVCIYTGFGETFQLWC